MANWPVMGSKWDRTAPRCKTGAQIYDAKRKWNNTDVNIPCKPLTNTEDGEAHEDEAFDEDSGQCNLEWDHT